MKPGIEPSLNPAPYSSPAPHDELQPKVIPLLPSADPFYQPPPGYQAAPPGTVLRSRDVELAFLSLIPQRLTATQLLYRTADMHGTPEATVTTVLIPADGHERQSRPILSYQCAIDAVAERCFPSYALRRRAKAFGAVPQFELLLIAAALAQGWAVSVCDHEGLRGRFIAPYEPGYRALDGVRAAISTERLGLSADPPVGLWGYSGGGLASAWAAEVSATYAPELNIVGAVLGSPVGDPGLAFRRLNGTLASGLPALAIAALARTYPDFDRMLHNHFNGKGRALLGRVETMTTVDAVVRLAGKDLGRYADRPLGEILSMPEVQHIFNDTKLGTAGPAAPVLIVQAVHDPLISVTAVDTLADVYTTAGTHVTYHRDMASEHGLLAIMSAPIALQWLRDRFADLPLDAPKQTRWPLLLSPAAYVGILRLTRIVMRVITGRAVWRRGATDHAASRAGIARDR